jgi:hypothetical protein
MRVGATASGGEPAPRLIVQLSEADLEVIVERAAARAVEAQRPAPEYLTRQRLAEALDVSVSLIDRMTREGMPCVLVGDSRRYRLPDVHAWLAARTTAGGE